MNVKSGPLSLVESIVDQLFRGEKPKFAKWLGHFDLLDALEAQPGCPICNVVSSSIDKYIDGYLYESVTDPGFRAMLRKSRGFCSDHAWRAMQTEMGGLGMAITYEDIVGTLLKTLRNEQNEAREAFAPGFLLWWKRMKRIPTALDALIGKLKPSAICPACQYGVTMERVYVRFAVDLLSLEGPDADNNLPERLCFAHFLQLLPQLRTRAEFDILVGRHLAQLESLHHELAEFVRKNDYRFRSEGFGPEGDAWQRAPLYVAGPPGFLSLKNRP